MTWGDPPGCKLPSPLYLLDHIIALFCDIGELLHSYIYQLFPLFKNCPNIRWMLSLPGRAWRAVFCVMGWGWTCQVLQLFKYNLDILNTFHLTVSVLYMCQRGLHLYDTMTYVCHSHIFCRMVCSLEDTIDILQIYSNLWNNNHELYYPSNTHILSWYASISIKHGNLQ